jgi:crotonobetainyl-CoA:carnitine CoA-transferase CaiB-like acyl-CoA transferase
MEMDNTGALDGIKVLDLSSVLMGPLAAQMLGDMGADSALERVGLSYAALAKHNPSLIYCHLKGFSDSGPMQGNPRSMT